MTFPVLDRIKGSIFRYVPGVYLYGWFYKIIYYLIRNGTFNRLNYQQALKKIEALNDRPPGTLVVESTNFCNAKCTMCTIPSTERQRGFMNQKLFERIVEDASRSGIGLINIQYIGEPLMDEKLFERIRLIKKYGLSVMFHTNGSLLDGEKAKLILETGVNTVGISLDAFSKGTYEKVRRGLILEDVVRNVISLMEVKKKGGDKLPLVKVNYVLLDENLHEVRSFYNFWHRRVDHINVTFAHNWAGKLDVRSHPSMHVADHLPHLIPCDMLWKEMVVFHDGRVPLCCMDNEGSVIMGDLKTQGIMEVWKGEKFQNYRRNHVENKRALLPLCNSCSRYSFWF